MISESDVSTRQILTFPAAHLCEFVSPTTLVSSLVSLSCKICKFKPSDFVLNKRKASNAIRLVGVLKFILQEIQDGNPDKLFGSSLVSLSKLHLVFQKIGFLLEDCARKDARMWVLMNLEEVANHFHNLMRSLAATFNVLPLDLIDVSLESRDYIDFVIKQARESRFEVEKRDAWCANLVISILGKFESKIIPNPNDLKRVMGHLSIEKWSDCNREIKFLEDEIVNSESSEAEKEKNSGLLFFMVYCRCVLFDSIDMESNSIFDEKSNKFFIGCLTSDDFRCPISLEIMVDPVTISTGHTYDRVSILKWFRLGNLVCPKTTQKLEALDMVPNLALHRLIKLYCSQNGISLPHKHTSKCIISARSLIAEEAVKMAADFLVLKLTMGTNKEKNKAAYEVRLITKRSVFVRDCLVESGAIPLLINLLLCNEDGVLQENSIAALLNLSKNSKVKKVIVENNGLPLIVEVLRKGTKVEARQHAAAVLFYLSSVEEYRGLIGGHPGAIPSLVDLIRDGGGDRGKKNALVAIFGLLMNPRNHYRVLEARIVPLLVNLLRSSENEDLIVDSLAVLSTLGEKPEGATAILNTGILDIVVGILGSLVSRFGKEHCVSLLLALCINGGREAVEVLVKNPSLMGALYSLLTEGTSRASKKARSLIAILLEFSERSPARLMHHALPHGNFIHVW